MIKIVNKHIIFYKRNRHVMSLSYLRSIQANFWVFCRFLFCIFCFYWVFLSRVRQIGFLFLIFFFYFVFLSRVRQIGFLFLILFFYFVFLSQVDFCFFFIILFLFWVFWFCVF